MESPLIGNVAIGFNTTPPELAYSETSKGLKNAAQDFTSVLYSMMFTVMRGNPEDNPKEEGESGGLFSGENFEMFSGFLDQEIGKKFASQGGQEMVTALYNQLKGHLTFKDDQKDAQTLQNNNQETLKNTMNNGLGFDKILRVNTKG